MSEKEHGPHEEGRELSSRIVPDPLGIEAEFLGTVMHQDAPVATRLLSEVSLCDFTDPDCRLIYTAALTLSGRGVNPGPKQVCSYVSDAGLVVQSLLTSFEVKVSTVWGSVAFHSEDSARNLARALRAQHCRRVADEYPVVLRDASEKLSLSRLQEVFEDLTSRLRSAFARVERPQ